MTAIPAVLAAMMGPGAATGGAVMWRRLMAALIVVLAAAQATSFRAAWLTPVLGPGIMELARESLPAAGIFSLSAAGWLMIAEGEDKRGRTIPVSLIRSGLATVALVVMFGMLTPGIPGEPAVRSVRLGRLLANDRAGLSLELPYVTLIFGGMLTMLVFELAAAACAVRLVLPNVRYVFCAAAAGGIALLIALSGLSEREAVSAVSGWYYPAAALPFCTAGISACIRKRMEGRKADKKGKRA